MTPDSRKTVFAVVLNPNLTDNAAGSVRNGIRMFHGVQRVVPMEAMPGHDGDLLDAIRRDVMGESYEHMRLLEQRVAELSGRLSRIQDEATGGLPAQPYDDDPLRDVPLWTRKNHARDGADMRDERRKDSA